MPKIIRSSTVSIDCAKPIIVRAVVNPREQQQGESDRQHWRSRVEPTQSSDGDVFANAEQVVDDMLSRARTDAGTIVENAREETRKVLQQAIKEGLEQGHEQGYTQGRQKGYAEAHRQTEALYQSAERQIEQILDSLRIERQNIIRTMEKDVVNLVFDIVDKVLDIAMDRSDEWIQSRVRLALKQLENDTGTAVRVSQQDLKRVIATTQPMLRQADKLEQLKITADENLPRGSFVIDTKNGSIDTSVETKRNRAAELLLERT